MNNKVLVTGGTGFLSMRIIYELLKEGHIVKTTLRSLDKKDKVIQTMQANNVATENLTFIEADLSKDDNWVEAMKDCDNVLSVASPVFFDKPKNEEEVIRPAIDGIKRILKFADETNVKRVVMTSNFGAVGFSNKDKSSITSEDNWTNEDEKGLSVYEKSKLLAEKAAWQYINDNNSNLELATINPVAILGPSLDEHVSGSFGLIKNLVTGAMSRIPNIALNVVDVRDVAKLHILAMTNEKASGQRFIATSDGQISMPEIAQLIKSERPALASNISTKLVPNFALTLGALFNHEAKEGKLLLNMNRNVSNNKAKEILGWQPIANKEEAILASLDSLHQHKII